MKKVTDAPMVRFDLTQVSGPQVIVAGKFIAIRHPSWVECYERDFGQWYPMICWNNKSLNLLDGDWKIFKTNENKIKGSIGKNLLPGQANTARYQEYLIASSKETSLAEINAVLNKFYNKYLHYIMAGEMS